MIYFAYGSNLNIEQMRRRCPRAIPLGKFYLYDAKLVFRGVADCVYAEGSKCPGGLWKITTDCLHSLDAYEGRRADGSGTYRREWVELDGIPNESRLLYYSMNSTGIFPPTESYLKTIIEGYRDFDLPLDPLKAAVKAAWADRNPSHIERQRHRRTGRPRLGQSSDVIIEEDKSC